MTRAMNKDNRPKRPGGRPTSPRGPGGPRKPGGKADHSKAPRGARFDKGHAAKGRPDKARRAAAEEAGATEAAVEERVAKVIARAGLCSRRTAESWVVEGRVAVNGIVLKTPAVTVTPSDRITVDDEPLPERERTRLWLYHKPRGLVTTNHDPEGRPTVFERLPRDLPRVLTIGRLDINTEGLLLLTNDGGLARILELPETGWLRRYRVRAYGRIAQTELDKLADGVSVDGILYGAIEASLDKEQGDNVWLTIALREGKNREIKKVLEHLGLSVNRLIRVSFGPFQLAELPEGEVREIRGRVLRDQLGERLAKEASADFEAPLLGPGADSDEKPARAPAKATARAGRPAPQQEGRYLSKREGEAEFDGRGRKKRDGDRDGRRKPEAGDRKTGSRDAPAKATYISPRSRFRFTPDLMPRGGGDQRPEQGARRRVWDEDGSLIEENGPAPERDTRGKGGDRTGPGRERGRDGPREGGRGFAPRSDAQRGGFGRDRDGGDRGGPNRERGRDGPREGGRGFAPRGDAPRGGGFGRDRDGGDRGAPNRERGRDGPREGGRGFAPRSDAQRGGFGRDRDGGDRGGPNRERGRDGPRDGGRGFAPRGDAPRGGGFGRDRDGGDRGGPNRERGRDGPREGGRGFAPRGGPNKGGPGSGGPGRGGPGAGGPGRGGPGRNGPSRSGPSRNGPSRNGPGKGGPGRGGPDRGGKR
jgi:23S rRNA pseudouridine2605 synthase